MGKRRVLLIVEDQKQEPLLMHRLFEVYDLDMEYEIYSYGANIHDLYNRFFCSGDDPSDLSLLGVLSEMEKDSVKKKLFTYNYSDILLVFDYDPQDNRFCAEHLREMQEYFSESTDEGKLYLNYPMVEACRHFISFPDPDFLNRSVSRDEIRNYKEIVGRETAFQNFQRDFGKCEFDFAISHSLVKGHILIGKNGPTFDNLKSAGFDHCRLLDAQNAFFAERGNLPVLGTCLFFVSDYFPNLVSTKFAEITSFNEC